MRTTNHLFRDIVVSAILALAVLVPSIGLAQETSADLRATIRAELLSDPRTAGMTQGQIDILVDLLAQEAEKRGITSQDIQWRPQSTEQFVATDAAPAPTECSGGFLCIMTEAFGFVGGDSTIPFTLGAASMGLVWILAEMIHRRRHPAQMGASAPVSGV